jgi:hypothetical protein
VNLKVPKIKKIAVLCPSVSSVLLCKDYVSSTDAVNTRK